MALTAAYFTGELLIPNISGSTYAEVQNLARLYYFIDKYEVNYLKMLLGEDFYAEYAAAIALNPTSGIWHDLNDQIYQVSGTFYQSPVACYVYYKFMYANRSLTTAPGEAAAKLENADRVSSGLKMVTAWNTMCDLVDDLREWLDDHSTDYTTWGSEEVTEFERLNQFGI